MASRQSQPQRNIRAYFKPLLLTALCGSFIQCSSGSKKADPPGGKWKSRMQELGEALVDIYPYLLSRKEFNAPENRQKIQQSAKRLASLAHNVNKQRAKSKLNTLDRDPLVSVISNNLDGDLNLATEALQNGEMDLSRTVLKNAAFTCVRCHSRGSWGPQLVNWKKNENFQKLQPLEKGTLLAAVRLYDQALVQLKDILANEELASKEPNTLVKATDLALNVTVRVQQDPAEAERVVQAVLSNTALPLFQRSSAEDWLQAVQRWKGEKSRKKESLLAKAKRILKKIWKEEDYRGDRSFYIDRLRASALLHDFLRTKASRGDHAKALLYLGNFHDLEADMGISDTNEIYYKACIKHLPHSETSLECYRNLERNVFLDYPDRGVFSFPRSMMDHLRALRDLATPIEEKSDFGKGMFERE